MLAIAVQSEFDYDIDIKKVIYMLAVHELEETIIGDITPFDDNNKDKKQLGRDAVVQILKPLAMGDEILAIITEYEENKTLEARFAKWVDKLDSGLQCKIYDMAGHVDVSDDNIDIQRRVNLEKRNYGKLSDSWLEFCIENYNFDENFIKLAREARKDENWNKIN